MARQVFINIDTNLNFGQVTDMADTGMVFDSYSALGAGFSFEREDGSIGLAVLSQLLKIHTPLGSTGFFDITEFGGLTVDGNPVVVGDLQDLVDNVSPYFFA